jgi:hypothetical protein
MYVYIWMCRDWLHVDIVYVLVYVYIPCRCIHVLIHSPLTSLNDACMNAYQYVEGICICIALFVAHMHYLWCISMMAHFVFKCNKEDYLSVVHM